MQESLILRRASLTVGSPSAYFMNKGNSTTLWQCQKVNRILRKSFCVSLLLQSGPVSSGWVVEHSWSPCSGVQVPSGLFTARALLVQAQTRVESFFPLSYSFQLSQQSGHSTKTPVHRGQCGPLAGWADRLWTKGTGADGQGSPRMRPSQRAGSGHF